MKSGYDNKWIGSVTAVHASAKQSDLVSDLFC